MYTISYAFWPVGQGLFSSGVLNDSTGKPRFRWVYDCGTTSSKSHVRDSLAKYQQEQFPNGSNPEIDMVVISHFDTDHISGMVALLKTFSVGTLVLPYMPLWQRLLVAFANGVDTQQRAMGFYTDPVTFILDASGERGIQRIVFVSASGAGQPDQNPVGGGDDDPERFRLEGRFLHESVLDDEQKLLADRSVTLNNGTQLQVKFLERDAHLVVNAIWEFVPYNDASAKIKTTAGTFSAFKQKVAKEKAALLTSPSDAAMVRLKNLYDARFGSNGIGRNLISLFMYAGPLRSAVPRPFSEVIVSSVEGEHIHHCWNKVPGRCSVLYTGDGYLDSKKRFGALSAFMGKPRMAMVSCMQVMHHGAKGNWFEGLGELLSPDISVFSSDPAHKKFGHPHGCVVRDFLRFGPVQVDKANGLGIEYRLFP